MKNRILLAILLAFIIIQFITIEQTNPTIKYNMAIDDNQVGEILKKACFDCHSNETRWPWYSNIAPISWLIEEDVNLARKELNFSNFEDYTKKRKLHKLDEMKEEMEEGKMPIDSYVFLHSEAELSSNEKQLVYNWIDKKKSEINHADSLITQ